MKKLIFAVGFLAVANVAHAAPLLMTVVGSGWSNPVGPAGICADIDNAAAPWAQDEIRWNGEDLIPFAGQPGGDGCGLAPAGETPFLTSVSGYNFDPTDGIMAFLPGTSATFSLGTFEHINEPISDAITSVDYELDLLHNDFSAPPADPLALNLTFLHNETDNIPTADNPNCCDDIVTVVLPVFTTTFQVGGDSYIFSLLGFSPTGAPGTFGTQFSSPEGNTNTTQLWAQITPNPVPEPATLTLLGTGLLGLGAAARRRLRKQAS